MGEVWDEVKLVSFGVGHPSRLYQYISGGDEGARAEVIERVNKGLFLVQKLVIVN